MYVVEVIALRSTIALLLEATRKTLPRDPTLSLGFPWVGTACAQLWGLEMGGSTKLLRDSWTPGFLAMWPFTVQRERREMWIISFFIYMAPLQKFYLQGLGLKSYDSCEISLHGC